GTTSGTDSGNNTSGSTAGTDSGNNTSGTTSGTDAGSTTSDGGADGSSTATDGNASDGGTSDATTGSTDSGTTDGTGGDGTNPDFDTSANPDTASVFQGETVLINVLVNDNDGVGDGLTIVSFTDPPNGSVTREGTEELAYTPDFGFYGIDTFMYVIEDGQGEQATGTVTVEVIRFSDINDNAINDYDECNCVSLTLESGIHGSGLGGKLEWLSIFALFVALIFRRRAAVVTVKGLHA
nr:cadherin-like domain-containing protein [Gammaproteobacteria bacterium]